MLPFLSTLLLAITPLALNTNTYTMSFMFYFAILFHSRSNYLGRQHDDKDVACFGSKEILESFLSAARVRLLGRLCCTKIAWEQVGEFWKRFLGIRLLGKSYSLVKITLIVWIFLVNMIRVTEEDLEAKTSSDNFVVYVRFWVLLTSLTILIQNHPFIWFAEYPPIYYYRLWCKLLK